MVAVVFGHSLGGIIDMPGEVAPSLFHEIFLGIYIFHMPLFFFLSGLMVRPRLERSSKSFLIDIFASVAYPYFLWSIIQYSVIYGAGSLVNRPVAVFWPTILKLPISSISQFWFLYVLFLLHIAAFIIVPRLGARNFFLIAVVAKFAVPLLGLPTMFRLSLVHGIFYALGVFAGVGGVEALRNRVPLPNVAFPALALVGILVTIVAATLVIDANAGFFALGSWEITALAWRLPMLPAGALAASGVLALAFICRSKLAEILAYIGRRTMAIFVLHVLFVAGVRIALTRHGHHPDPALLLAISVSLGLAAPLAIHAIAKRFSSSRALGLG